MKIFWSWQSDTPGKTGRFLIRDALRDAIQTLKVPPDVEEPTSKDSRDALHLDQDIQGVTGIPDLARTIFDKIDQAQVVIADVTQVGLAESGSKKLINSNVAIELGYALRAVGDKHILIVFNSHYGTHADLPFDLRHKGGAMVFSLPPNAEPSQIQAQRKQLKDGFIKALRPLIAPNDPVAPFAETLSTYNKATYFPLSVDLARSGEGQSSAKHGYLSNHFAYIRFIPTRPLPSELSLSRFRAIATHLDCLSRNFNRATQLNQYGLIAFETYPEGQLSASTQLFQNGEIWSISADILTWRHEEGDPPGLPYPFLPSLAFEQIFHKTMHSLAAFATNHLGIAPPWTIELGLTGIAEIKVAVDISIFEKFWGPIRKPEVILRRVINEATPAAIDSLLLEFFSTVYDASGHSRPEGFFGFPPGPPGSRR